MRRGQLSLSALEAGVGVLLLTAVAAGFFLVGDGPDGRSAQLDTYARDAGVVLTTAGDGGPTLERALGSEAAWTGNRTALRERAAALFPANVLFRVETPRGAVGSPAPGARPVGTARVPTSAGPVTIRVWYP